MKKANVINLIKYYTEHNDSAFRNEAYQIAKEFDNLGDYQISEYIMALLSSANTFVPQIDNEKLVFAKKISTSNNSLPLPDVIKSDIIGVINATGHNIGINKFLFEGFPGTGKTETAKHIARILDRELFLVDCTHIIDSKLGQTGKNIAELFSEINSLRNPSKAVILFDEIDEIALNRTDERDLREIGRATTSLLSGLDNLDNKILLIATTNLYSYFDKAILRRFDYTINFNRYTKEDLIEISEIILNEYLSNFKKFSRNMRLFKKIMSLKDELPYPGDLKNLIKTSLAFSNPEDEYDYLRRLYSSVLNKEFNFKSMQEQGFTLREIEILSGVSKSQVFRELKEKCD